MAERGDAMEAGGKSCLLLFRIGLFLCLFWSGLLRGGENIDALVVSAPAAGTDEIPPAPVGWIQAEDVPGDHGGQIQISWILSPDDEVQFVGLAPEGYVPGTGGAGRVIRRRGVSGYRIYRYEERTSPRRIGEVEAGVDHYLDAEVEDGVLYFYEVRAFDSEHETLPEIEPGSAADQARSARAVNDASGPVDEEGRPVIGWFDPSDRQVDFNDFFIFADHFGCTSGEGLFEDRFDLNGDLRIDFNDFFIFADHFGQVVANYEILVKKAK